jgi:hypothetical protein
MMILDTLLTAFLIMPALVFAYVGLLFGLGPVLSPERLRSIRRSLWPLRLTLWQMMVGVAVAAFLILVFEKQLGFAIAFFTISLLILAWFVHAWNHEFVFLMGLRDEDLPGRHDKLIWAFLLFTFAPIAIWFFRSYRLAHWPEPAAESDFSLRPEPAGHTVTQPTGI